MHTDCASSSCACAASTQSQLAKLGTAVVILGAFPLAHAITPLLLRDAFPFCPFRQATGKPCPLCGMTRAIALATHRRWHEAFKYNPLWPIAVAVMLGFSLLLLIDAFTRRNLSGRLAQALSRHVILVAAGLIMFGVWRILRGV
jgi:hypothetical protein